jgi:hypothetical protein
MRLKLPKVPGKVMDDTQRVVLSGLGGALMAAGVAWPSIISAVASYSWPVWFLPAGALFGAGVLLFVWAFLSGPDSKRELLDRAIADGRTISQLTGLAEALHWEKWEEATFVGLQEDFGLQVGFEFGSAGEKAGADLNDVGGNLRAQIAFLESLRKSQ